LLDFTLECGVLEKSKDLHCENFGNRLKVILERIGYEKV